MPDEPKKPKAKCFACDGPACGTTARAGEGLVVACEQHRDAPSLVGASERWLLLARTLEEVATAHERAAVELHTEAQSLSQSPDLETRETSATKAFAAMKRKHEADVTRARARVFALCSYDLANVIGGSSK